MTHVTMAEKTIVVSLAEIKLSADMATSLVCFGLGSCIGLCVYEPALKLAGLAHIVLPKSPGGSKADTATKYADVAVPTLLAQMAKLGASKQKLIVKLAGGAQMIQMTGMPATLEMGNKNIEATRQCLRAEGIRITAEDVGGNHGRSIWLSVATGEVTIRTAGISIKYL